MMQTTVARAAGHEPIRPGGPGQDWRARGSPPGQPPAWADQETLEAVRPEVFAILTRAPAFSRLSDTERLSIAQTMVKVAAYMANPDGLAKEELADPNGGLLRKDDLAPATSAAIHLPPPPPPTRAGAGGPLARAQEDAVEEARQKAAGPYEQVGRDFVAGGVRQGVEQFGELVKKVDFPRFVGGLIQNVFQAIVDASIQQMEAYADLLANVAKTVDQFAQDNITSNNARDWLVNKYPEGLGMEADTFGSGFDEEGVTPRPQARVTITSDDAEGLLRQISSDLGLARPITDISDENEELRLVQAAKLQIARGRQQLLASMVVLGINRIVVTDGLIHAKVVFAVNASDRASRQDRASLYDSERTVSQAGFAAVGWCGFGAAAMGASTQNDHVTTVESSVDESSESRAQLKAQLTGEVRVNFKSDYFPMERMATPQMIAAIQGNADPATGAAARASGAGGTPAPAGAAAPATPAG